MWITKQSTCSFWSTLHPIHLDLEVSDVVEALTTILICCRLATRTDPKLNKEGTDGALVFKAAHLG